MTVDEQLAALAVTVERTGRQVEQLALSVQDQAKQQRAMAVEQITLRTAVAGMRAAQKPAEGPYLDWMLVEDPDLAVSVLREVDSWVHRVWRHYQTMPDCWAWHPAIVAELVACQAAHRGATSDGAGLSSAADWHIRFQSTSARTIRTRLTDCGRATGHLGAYAVDRSCLDDLATWWASRLTDPTAPEPGLTPMET